jgi:predicted lipoprotein
MISRRPRRGWVVLATLLLVWLVVDRPWTVRPIGHQAAAAPFDATAYVDGIWTSRVRSQVNANAVAIEFFRGVATTSPTGARAVAVAVEGRVVSIDTSSRVGVALVDTDPADGAPDAAIQIGPVLRGTALRDALEFIRFTDFTNQLEFAAVAGALNDRVLSDVLGAVDFSALEGRWVRVVGATVMAANVPDALPSIVPVHFVVEDRP